MEKNLAMSPKIALSGHQTPPRNQPNKLKSPTSSNEIRKTSTPDRLHVPKPFKYPERYTSPTDLMMSPVSKGLLARSRKNTPLLPPIINQTHMVGASKLQEVGLFAEF